MSRLNAKGDTPSSIVLWLAVTTAVLIMVGWYATHLYPQHIDVTKIDYDLSEIKAHINNACKSSFYKARVNPKIERGYFLINGSNICINSTRVMRCRFVLCDTGINKTIYLENLTYIVIDQNENFSLYAE